MEAAGHSLADLAGAKIDDLGFEQIQGLIENLVQREAARRKTSPNELIRVVRDGEIVWMTAEEADQMLTSTEEGGEDRLRTSVERALKGETRILHVELKAMLAVALGMLDRYVEEKSVDPNEAKRIRPVLVQLGRRIATTVNQLKEVETRIQAYRNSHPIFDEFEGKMGQLLNLQRMGRNDEATQLAQQLGSLRMKYVRLSRGLISDNNIVYGHRLDLQKNKKSILSNQRYLAVQREGTLKETVEERQKRLGLLCRGKSLEEALQGESAAEVKACSDELHSAEGELKAVSKGLKVIEVQEKEVESVISQIVQNVMKEETPPQEEKPAKPKEPEPTEAVEEEKPKTRVHRMVITERRK